MKKQTIMVLGIIIIVVITGLLYWWFNRSKPTQSEIDSATKLIKQVNTTILTGKTTQEVEKRKVFGNVPVEISSDYGHSKLFE